MIFMLRVREKVWLDLHLVKMWPSSPPRSLSAFPTFGFYALYNITDVIAIFSSGH